MLHAAMSVVRHVVWYSAYNIVTFAHKVLSFSPRSYILMYVSYDKGINFRAKLGCTIFVTILITHFQKYHFYTDSGKTCIFF